MYWSAASQSFIHSFIQRAIKKFFVWSPTVVHILVNKQNTNWLKHALILKVMGFESTSSSKRRKDYVQPMFVFIIDSMAQEKNWHICIVVNANMSGLRIRSLAILSNNTVAPNRTELLGTCLNSVLKQVESGTYCVVKLKYLGRNLIVEARQNEWDQWIEFCVWLKKKKKIFWKAFERCSSSISEFVLAFVVIGVFLIMFQIVNCIRWEAAN